MSDLEKRLRMCPDDDLFSSHHKVNDLTNEAADTLAAVREWAESPPPMVIPERYVLRHNRARLAANGYKVAQDTVRTLLDGIDTDE